MAEKSPFQKYLDGEPVNEALARVRDGLVDVPEEVPAAAPVVEIRTQDKALQRRDRQELKEAVRTEGWAVVLRIQRKLDQRNEKSAISLSQDNPLQNRDRIAEAWLYKNMFQKAMRELTAEIERELAALDKDDER